MKKSEVTKDHILRQTRALLAAEGGSALSMRKLAEASGISLGNLQYHFPTRDHVMVALLALFIDDYSEQMKTLAVKPSGNVRQDVELLLTGALEALDTSDSGRLFRELWAAAQNSDSLTATLDRYYHDLSTFYASTLKALAGDAQDAAIERAVTLILPLMEGFCVTKNVLPQDRKRLASVWAAAIRDCLDNEPM